MSSDGLALNPLERLRFSVPAVCFTLELVVPLYLSHVGEFVALSGGTCGTIVMMENGGLQELTALFMGGCP